MPDRPTRPPSPPRFRRICRAPAAVIAGLALVLGTPFLIGGAAPAGNQVLGEVATPAPTSAPTAGPQAPADFAGLVSYPDPSGEGSSPSRRFPPPLETLTGYAWPIWNASLTLPFGPTGWGSRVVNGEPFHDGIDLATHCGDRIVAAHDGIVLAAGRRYDDFMGWAGDLTAYKQRLDEKQLWGTLPIVVVIDDGNGFRSIYAHFRRVVVAPGDVVAAGDLLGYEGATGRATGCHLHYGLFSPHEVATFRLNAEAAAHMLLPTELAARIDPLLVLPPLEDALIH